MFQYGMYLYHIEQRFMLQVVVKICTAGRYCVAHKLLLTRCVHCSVFYLQITVKTTSLAPYQTDSITVAFRTTFNNGKFCIVHL